MNKELVHELNELSLEELYNLLLKIEELKNTAKGKIIEVKKTDVKSIKRGTKS